MSYAYATVFNVHHISWKQTGCFCTQVPEGVNSCHERRLWVLVLVLLALSDFLNPKALSICNWCHDLWPHYPSVYCVRFFSQSSQPITLYSTCCISDTKVHREPQLQLQHAIVCTRPFQVHSTLILVVWPVSARVWQTDRWTRRLKRGTGHTVLQ